MRMLSNQALYPLLASRSGDPNRYGHIWGEYIFNEASTLTIQNTNQIDTIAPYRGSANQPFAQHASTNRPIYTPNYFSGRAVAIFNGLASSDNYLSAGTTICWSSSGMTILWAGVLSSSKPSQMILSKHGANTNGSFFLAQTTVGTLTFTLINVNSTRVNLNVSGMPTDQFIVVGCTYDGTTMRIYLDGIEVGNISQTGVIKNYSANLMMGNYTILDYTFNGAYGHLLVYDEPLTADKVRSCTWNYIKPYWGITSEIWYEGNYAAWYDDNGIYYFTPQV